MTLINGENSEKCTRQYDSCAHFAQLWRSCVAATVTGGLRRVADLPTPTRSRSPAPSVGSGRRIKSSLKLERSELNCRRRWTVLGLRMFCSRVEIATAFAATGVHRLIVMVTKPGLGETRRHPIFSIMNMAVFIRHSWFHYPIYVCLLFQVLIVLI